MVELDSALETHWVLVVAFSVTIVMGCLTSALSEAVAEAGETGNGRFLLKKWGRWCCERCANNTSMMGFVGVMFAEQWSRFSRVIPR